MIQYAQETSYKTVAPNKQKKNRFDIRFSYRIHSKFECVYNPNIETCHQNCFAIDIVSLGEKKAYYSIKSQKSTKMRKPIKMLPFHQITLFCMRLSANRNISNNSVNGYEA